MVVMKSNPLELRGVVNKATKTGKVYYILYVENEEGKPFQFYCPSAECIEQGLKKGDKVTLTFNYSVFDKQERVYVAKVSKVA